MNIVKSAQIFAESLIIFLFFGSIRNQDQIQEFSINVQPIGNASDSLFGFSVAWGTSDLVVGEPYASNLTGMIYIVNGSYFATIKNVISFLNFFTCSSYEWNNRHSLWRATKMSVR